MHSTVNFKIFSRIRSISTPLHKAGGAYELIVLLEAVDKAGRKSVYLAITDALEKEVRDECN
jgi:hypothetical protein